MPEQVFQSIATKEGSVEKIPVNSNDITNKNYVDNLITTLTIGTLLVTSIIIGSLIKLSEDDEILFNETLSIEGTTSQADYLFILNETSSTDGTGEFAQFVDGDGQEIFGFDKANTGYGVLDIRGNTGTSLIRFAANADSYFFRSLGIGKTTPNFKLDVAGTINASGYSTEAGAGLTGSCASSTALTVQDGIIIACS